jgi:DNA-binding response OmpR family regulator
MVLSSSQTEQSMNPNRKYKILLVEDTAEYARLTTLILERAGYEVLYAPDGQRALDVLSEQLPDVLILDLNLPHISGWEVLKQMNAMYPDHKRSVIVTTAYSDSANRLVGKLQEVYSYLTKPFTPQDLIFTVNSALGIR